MAYLAQVLKINNVYHLNRSSITVRTSTELEKSLRITKFVLDALKHYRWGDRFEQSRDK